MAYKAVETLGRGSEDGAYSMMQAGRCYNQLRRHKEALQCYERFLDDYKKSQWADDAGHSPVFQAVEKRKAN